MDSTTQTPQALAFPVPDHVPPELVRPYPFALRGTTTDVLPRTLIPEIHKGPPVFWAKGAHPMTGGAWVPRRYEDLQKIYQDTAHFTTTGTSGMSWLIGETWSLIPSEIDGPEHAKYRHMLNPMLAPSRIAHLDEKIRAYARERLLELRDRGSCDFVADFAFEFPIRVFVELMGFPQETTPQLLNWEHGILRSQTLEPVIEALRGVTAYLDEQNERHRQAPPQNDMMTLVLQAELDGRKLTPDEIKGFGVQLFLGGLDTVSTNMSAHFRHLAENVDDQNYLRANPDKIPDAIEEMMRAYAAVTTLRRCIADTEIAGVKIKEGDIVLTPTYLAANDPEVFENPEKVDFNRKPRHVSFGHGAHLCIGIHLARREMRIAMEEALSILPEFRVAPGAKIESFCSSGPIGPLTLPIVWDK